MTWMALVVAITLQAAPSAKALANEGTALATAGDVQGGLLKLDEAHRLEPNNPNILFNLARVREMGGDISTAIDHYERYLMLVPGDPEAPKIRTHVAQLKATSAQIPEAAHDALAKGQAYLKLERFADALGAFKEAEQLAPDWPAALFNLGVVSEHLKHFDSALKYFRRYLPLASEKEAPAIRLRIADLQIKVDDERKAKGPADSGQHREAQAEAPVEMKEPPESLSEDAQNTVRRGIALVRMGRLADAKKAFIEAERLEPAWLETQFNLGVVAEKEQQFDETVKRFKRYFAQAKPEEKAALRARIVDAEIKRDDQLNAPPAAPVVESESTLLFRVADDSKTFEVMVDSTTGTQRCPETVTFLRPCTLQISNGPAQVHVAGDASFTRNIEVTSGVTERSVVYRPPYALIGAIGMGTGVAAAAGLITLRGYYYQPYDIALFVGFGTLFVAGTGFLVAGLVLGRGGLPIVRKALVSAASGQAGLASLALAPIPGGAAASVGFRF